MDKSIVEQAKRKIWFKTETVVGTKSFVELPKSAVGVLKMSGEF